MGDAVSILPDPASFMPVFVFDVVTGETHEGINEPTKFPVELGADISDHIKVNPTKYTVTGVVSMTPNGGSPIPTVLQIEPLPVPGPFVAAEETIAGLLSGGGPPFGPQAPTIVSPLYPFNGLDADPISDAHDALEGIRTRKVLCVITSTTKEYTDMALSSLTLNRKDDEGKGEFTLIFEKIITVQSATVAAPKPVIKAGVPKTSGGAQTPTPTTPADKATALKGVVDAGINFVKGFSVPAL
jgi:hypothetical protein